MSNDIPVCTTQEEYVNAIDAFDEANQPALLVKQVNRRKYAVVECDFITTESGRTPHAVINELGSRRLDSLFKRYHERAADDEKHKEWPITFSAPPKGATFISFDCLRRPVAEELAEEMGEIIGNDENWTRDRE